MIPGTIVFDLDGTLIDGYDAIDEALAHAMKSLGKEPPGASKSGKWSATGWRNSCEQAVGPRLAPEGVRLFREYYPEVAIEKSRLMPGVRRCSSASPGPDTRCLSLRTSRFVSRG